MYLLAKSNDNKKKKEKKKMRFHRVSKPLR